MPFRKIFGINLIVMMLYTFLIDLLCSRGDYITNARAIALSKNLFLIQLVINLLLLFWFIRSSYYRQVFVVNLMALIIVYYALFFWFFVTVN